MAKEYILALDQGTTSSRAIIFDRAKRMTASAQREFRQYYPREGWVEHDADEIFASQYAVIIEALAKSGLRTEDIAAIGITNQRETTVIWDRRTGKPVCGAIVWQCRRTADIVEELLKEPGLSDHIRQTTGLIPDAYFSATKIKWILDHIPGARQKAENGDLLFGTVDSWLIWKLTGGQVHATDRTNAARTMLYDIHKLDWDERLLRALDIPRSLLPEVRPSCGDFGQADIEGVRIPITGVAGDQQSALFGHGCIGKGEAKNTYGTGCFMLTNTGTDAVPSRSGLITTIAAGTGDEVLYALEGSVFVGGAVIQWLRDEMRFFTSSGDVEYLARKVPDSGGVIFVPAFTGMGAPYWDMYARGMLIGLTRGTRQEHIVRAAEESIAFQIADLLHAMEQDMGSPLVELKADGGACRDNFLMQFQADISDRSVYRPDTAEMTALGAAKLAGYAVGIWHDEDLHADTGKGTRFTPSMDIQQRDKALARWHEAVRRCANWAST